MLHSCKSSTVENYYDILSVKEDASYDDIRASYRVAALNSHPDKMSTKDEQIPGHAVLNDRFLKVRKAWEVLGNAETRRIYDRELSASRLNVILADAVRLEEMIVQDIGDGLEFLHPCRCGDNFSISSAELEEMGLSFNENGEVPNQGPNSEPMPSVVIPCYSCSLKIHLVLEAT